MLRKDRVVESYAVTRTRPRPRKPLIAVIAVLLLVLGAVGSWRFRREIRAVYWLGRTVLASTSMRNDGTFTNILFIHQSVGQHLIAQGNVRALFTQAGYDLWDQNYNYIGLTRPDGRSAGYSYNIPGDNTYPDGYANLFTQAVRSVPTNPFSAIMQHEIIVFKSCYPTSYIDTPGKLEAYKRYYLRIRDVADQHPDRVFVAFTPPPLVPDSTTPEAAARAREFANWLKSVEFLTGHANFRTFDFFDLLAEGDSAASDYNTLRAEYRLDQPGDSHPNTLANQTIGPQFVEFVINAANSYRAARE